MSNCIDLDFLREHGTKPFLTMIKSYFRVRIQIGRDQQWIFTIYDWQWASSIIPSSVLLFLYPHSIHLLPIFLVRIDLDQDRPIRDRISDGIQLCPLHVRLLTYSNPIYYYGWCKFSGAVGLMMYFESLYLKLFWSVIRVQQINRSFFSCWICVKLK